MDYAEIVKYISQRLSLRPPQKKSLEILEEVMRLAEVRKDADPALQLRQITGKYKTVTHFDRNFLSLCFALATGVGKTRLMGAFITFLHKAYGINNFLVIAPNLTIYDKLIADFTPGTPKYVFKGIDVFTQTAPRIITGDNYQSGGGVQEDDMLGGIVVNIFNIAKITAKDKGHLATGDEKSKVAKIRRISETIGESYFDYLSSRSDLVMLMDESHRYRAQAGAAAINELKPVLGIELTATPRTISGTNETPFRNIIYEYILSEAMTDGFVKEPAIATRKGFNSANYSKDSDELEQLKLNDGAHLHELTKVALANYAFNNNLQEVKPFMLVVAADKAHADQLEEYLTSPAFRDGAYAGKLIKVYSGMGAEEEEKMIGQLLEIEKPGNPVEIVIHVNKLSEGWDVTNLYTIVPLRAANSVNLVEQSIGRGLRLPYGKRTGVEEIDTLTIVSHDNYAAIIDQARAGKLKFMKSYIIGENLPEGGKKNITLVPAINALLRARQNTVSPAESVYIPKAAKDAFEKASPAAQAALGPIKEAADAIVDSGKPCDLSDTDAQNAIIKRAQAEFIQAGEVFSDHAGKEAIGLLRKLTMRIPKIRLVPRELISCGYHDFDLDTTEIPLSMIDDKIKVAAMNAPNRKVTYVESDPHQADMQYTNQLIKKMIALDDVDYDDNAELLHKLVRQCLDYLHSKLTDDAVNNVLRNNLNTIISKIHKQLKDHIVYEKIDYDITVEPGYHKLTESVAAIDLNETPRDFNIPLTDKLKIRSMVFIGFQKCLFERQKFDSDSELKFAGVLERASEVVNWFKPALSNFRISWHAGYYSPDFIVETIDANYICEVKSTAEMESLEVKDKMTAAILWCHRASLKAREKQEKPWHYLLVPHNEIDAAQDFDVVKIKFKKAQSI